MEKVNFIVMGAVKGGTTALHTYLMKHPRITMSNPKELSFFDRHFHKGFEWYEQYFQIEKMYFIKNEELRYQTQDTMNKLFKWLGLKKNKLKQVRNLIIPVGGLVREVERPQFTLKQRRPFIDNFVEDLKELEKITNWDLTNWKRK